MTKNTVLLKRNQVSSTNFTKNCDFPHKNDKNSEIKHSWLQKKSKLGPDSPSQR